MCPAPQYVSGLWDNWHMRRTLISSILVLGLLGSSPTPAQAIFGLSKCEKVKKEMLTLEKQILDVRNYQGYTYKQVVFRSEEEIWEPTAKSVKMYKQVMDNDPIPRIWKLATNNPKCFTNTQNMHIVKLKNSTYRDYFTYPVSVDKYINTGECKKLMENNDNKDYAWYSTGDIAKTKSIKSKCSMKSVLTASIAKWYESIYDQ